MPQYKLVTPKVADELMAVYEAYYTSGKSGSFEICKIEKVVSPQSLERFRYKRRLYEQKYPHKKDCLLLEAFHGTKVANLPQILEENFQPSKCKRDHYGQGVYFSKSAQYANQYCCKKDETKVLLLCWVLIGEYQEVQEFNAPIHQQAVDTFVDNQRSFRIIVKWEEDTFLPVYVIHLRNRTGLVNSMTYEKYWDTYSQQLSSRPVNAIQDIFMNVRDLYFELSNTIREGLDDKNPIVKVICNLNVVGLLYILYKCSIFAPIVAISMSSFYFWKKRQLTKQ